MTEFYVIKTDRCPDCDGANSALTEETVEDKQPVEICKTCKGTGRELESYSRLSEALKDLGFI